MSGYTPMMQQFLAVKAQHPHALLLYRMGDFYETFFDDAVIASRELEITLTARDGGKERVPMAGIPYHALDGYLKRLIEKGFRVAICEQFEETNDKGKKSFRREVVRVVTPGTLLEGDLLHAKSNNFLGAVSKGMSGYGIAHADVSTGELAVTQIQDPDMARREIERLGLTEVVLPHHDPFGAPKGATGTPWEGIIPEGVLVTWHNAVYFSPEGSEKWLLDHFGVKSLEGFGCHQSPQAIAAAGALLRYVSQTQMTALSQFRSLHTYHVSQHMLVDSRTARNLELFSTARDGTFKGSLLSVLDLTETAMGGRLLKKWLQKPLLEVRLIRERQSAVGELVNQPAIRLTLREALGDVRDIERLAGRVATGTANGRDLVALADSLLMLPRLGQVLASFHSPLFGELTSPDDQLLALGHTLKQSLLDHPPVTIGEGGLIREGVLPELDELRRMLAGDKEWISQLEESERERTGIKSLKINFNKAFGYFIEVSRANSHLVPDDYDRKQTLVNAERYITPALKAREETILGAEEKIKQLELRMFHELRQQAFQHIVAMQKLGQAIAQADVLAALAEVADRYHYTCPSVDDSEILEIRGGRHPVIERLIPAGDFVPNDLVMNADDKRLMILTGPNMAGKSTIMRQVALVVLLTQIGSWVPAEAAHVGVVDRLFTRVGAVDDLATGQSTFMVEMSETANILQGATKKSLILLDEIGRGTSTLDGISIAWAVSEHIAQFIGAKTIFATHYHELTRLSDVQPGVINFQVAVAETEDRIVFLHKLVPGGASRSYGVEVARLAGMPPSVIDRARLILDEIERRSRLAQQLKKVAGSDEPSESSVAQLPLFDMT